jgi:hypothetical protein
MALKYPPGAIRFMFRIKMQHYSCDFAPVSTNRIRVEEAQIRDDVLLVVNGQYGMEGAASATSGSSGGFCMGLSRNRLSSMHFAFGLGHIDDRKTAKSALLQ